MTRGLLKYVLVLITLSSWVDQANSGRFPRGVPIIVPTSNGGGSLMGIGPLAYYTNGPLLLNWGQGAGTGAYFVNLTAGGQQSVATTISNGQMDANGNLIAGAGLSPISFVQVSVFTPPPTTSLVPPLNGPSPWWNGLQMKISWTGTSTVTLPGTAFLGTGSTALNCAANSCTFTFGLNPGNVAFNFAITNVNDPPKNIVVYEAAYQSQVTAMASCTQYVDCNHFRPAWLDTIKMFGRLRTMDIMDINGSGQFDTSAMADFDHQICVACQYGGVGMTTGGGISGTVLTVTNVLGFSVLGINETVNGVGVTSGTKIVAGNCGSVCTGTGGAGTYQVNNSQTVSPGTTMFFSATTGYAGSSGAKGGVHPNVTIELARLTKADIFYNLPVDITDTGMIQVATLFRDHMPAGTRVFFQISNETWNPALGVTYWWMNAAALSILGPSFNGMQYAGYRMGQLMTIVQGVYGTNSYNAVSNPAGRWSGIAEGQFDTNNTAVTQFMEGFVAWQAVCSCSTKVTDLFSETIIAAYFADFPYTIDIQSVTPGNPTTINSVNSNVTNGDIVRIFVSTDGTVHLNNLNFVATRIDSNSFTIPINTTGSVYGGTMYLGNGRYYNMIDASNSCFVSSAASLSGSITGNVLTSSGVTGGPIVLGQGLSGQPGILANTYINSGSGSTWTLNNSVVGTVTGAMTTAPCATKYQFFSQQNSKFLMTGNNDFGYAGNGPSTINNFAKVFTAAAQFANAMGLQASQYEGGNHVVPISNINSEYVLNYQWDAAGNDPLYTPAKLYEKSFQLWRDTGSAFSAKYVDQYQAGTFSGLRYLGDSNPAWSAIVVENALGPYVPPPSPATWTATYAGDASNRSVLGTSCAGSCVDTLPAAVIGTSAASVKIIATMRGTGTFVSMTCDGVTVSSPDVLSVFGTPSAIFTIPVGAGSNTRSCTMTTSGSSFQARTFYVIPVTGLVSTSPYASGEFSAGNLTTNYTKNSLVLAIGACIGSFNATTGVTPPGANPTTTTLFSSIDTVNGVSEMAGFKWPYSSTIFSGSGGFKTALGCNDGGVAAIYK